MAVILFQSSFTELKELKWFLSGKKKLEWTNNSITSQYSVCVFLTIDIKDTELPSSEIVRTPIKEHWQNEANKKDNEATEIKWSTS